MIRMLFSLFFVGNPLDTFLEAILGLEKASWRPLGGPFGGLWGSFWGLLGAPWAILGASWAPGRSRCPQEFPKKAPRAPQDGPKRFQEASWPPKGFPETPKRPQEAT